MTREFRKPVLKCFLMGLALGWAASATADAASAVKKVKKLADAEQGAAKETDQMTWPAKRQTL